MPILRVFYESLRRGHDGRRCRSFLCRIRVEGWRVSLSPKSAILGDTNEEKEKALEAVDRVEAKCVARLVLTPSKMKEFVETMAENLQNYDDMMQMQLDLDEEE